MFICSNVLIHERKYQTKLHCDSLSDLWLRSDIKSTVLGTVGALARSASPGKCAASHSCQKLLISLESYSWKWHVSPWAIACKILAWVDSGLWFTHQSSPMGSDRVNFRCPTFPPASPMALPPPPVRVPHDQSMKKWATEGCRNTPNSCPQELSEVELWLLKLDASIPEDNEGWTRSSVKRSLLSRCKALGWPPAPWRKEKD